MKKQRPYVLSIAGFDPSSGAGVTSDMKTFEAHNVYGLGVCSAITYQNDREFERIDWLENNQVLEQISILSKRFQFNVAKIGLIKNLDILNETIDFLRNLNPEIRIIWDPILKASAGLAIHETLTINELRPILNKLFLFTPNLTEAKKIFGEQNEISSIIRNEICNSTPICNVLLTGCNVVSDSITDILFTTDSKLQFHGKSFNGETKHGTGCVLSASIVAQLACGATLSDACEVAKEYTEKFIKNNPTLLGYHINK